VRIVCIHLCSVLRAILCRSHFLPALGTAAIRISSVDPATGIFDKIASTPSRCFFLRKKRHRRSKPYSSRDQLALSRLDLFISPASSSSRKKWRKEDRSAERGMRNNPTRPGAIDSPKKTSTTRNASTPIRDDCALTSPRRGGEGSVVVSPRNIVGSRPPPVEY